MPFNWKTPLGYAAAFIVECVSTFAVAYSILPSLCLSLGSYLLVGAGIQAISNDFRILCERASNGNAKALKNPFSNMIKNIAEMKQLRDFKWIGLCSSSFIIDYFLFFFLNRMVATFTDFNQFNISSLFMWSVLTIRGTILIIHLELVEYFDRKSPIKLIFLKLFTLLFSFCSQRVCLTRSMWYHWRFWCFVRLWPFSLFVSWENGCPTCSICSMMNCINLIGTNSRLQYDEHS